MPCVPPEAAARYGGPPDTPKPFRGAGRVHLLGRCLRLDARKPWFGFERVRSLGRRPHPEKRGATSRARARRAARSTARAACASARARHSTLTRRPGQQIIVCWPACNLFVTYSLREESVHEDRPYARPD